MEPPLFKQYTLGTETIKPCLFDTPASPINTSVADIKQKNHLNHTLAVTRSISFQTIPHITKHIF